MKLLFVLIDGCRVDSLRAAHTPTIDALMERGSWTLDAKTVSPSLTLPILFSIFTSSDPMRHGVVNNEDRPGPASGTRTIVEQLRDRGMRSAFYYNWEQLKWLTPAGAMHTSLFMENNTVKGGDSDLALTAATLLARERPDFAFLYLGCLDEEGHRSGFGSSLYKCALERADQALNHVLGVLEKAGARQEYAVIVQSDHGGEGFEHNDPHPFVMTVPWIACGPGIREGHHIEQPVSVLDTIPTCARLLGVSAHAGWEGRVVSEAFD